MELLKLLEIDNNTIVFFTSDNGPHSEGGHDYEFFDSNGPLRGKKRDLYEGGIRVPMIVRWPGHIETDTISDHVSTFWDFLPTASDLAGIETPDGLDGISYMPTLLGRKQTKHEYLYWKFTERGWSEAIRSDRWKGVRVGLRGSLELYDLVADPGEARDVSMDHPDIAARLDALMRHANKTGYPEKGNRPNAAPPSGSS